MLASTSAPALRFPGFTEPWRISPLNHFAKKITKKNKDNSISNILSNSANLGIIPQSDYFDRDIANRENTDGYYVIEHGDFVYNPRKSVSAPYGPVNIYEGQEIGIISPLYLCFQISGIEPTYLRMFFKGCSWHRFIYENGDSGVRHDRVSIKDDLFLQLPVSYPTKEEQCKITSLLLLLDERIATQRRLIEDLEKLKSSIIEKVYCSPIENHPRLRINKKYGENWPIYELGNICTRITTKNINNEVNRVLTIAAQYGLIDQCLFFNKVVASENLSNYYLLNKGDFAYNKSYSGDYIWGAVKRLDKYDSGVLSPLYICFRPNNELVDSDYLLFYFESKKWHKGISEIVVEGARNHGLLNISVKDFFNMHIPLPSIDEQKELATMIRTVQLKIEHDRTILQRYEQQRSYILKEMFI